MQQDFPDTHYLAIKIPRKWDEQRLFITLFLEEGNFLAHHAKAFHKSNAKLPQSKRGTKPYQLLLFQ